MGLSYDEITEILKVIDSSSCDELIVETGDTKLVVRRKGAGNSHATGDAAAPVGASIPAPSASSTAPAPRGAVAAAAPTGTADVNVVHKAPHQIEVAAPMVGTFYRAPSPDALPFVEIGSVVRKGDALCLIEVMKLFTTIASDYDGRIVHIGAENGELVEYGRALFIIEPA